MIGLLSNAAHTKRLSNRVAAGVTAQTGTFDRMGYEGVRVTASLDVVVDGSVITLKLGQGAASDGSDAVDITGASVNLTGSSSSQIDLQVDCWQPTKRYITWTLTRTTQNATINNVMADLYGAKNEPVSSSDVALLAQAFGQ